jgi:uncharacterized protein YpmS
LVAKPLLNVWSELFLELLVFFGSLVFIICIFVVQVEQRFVVRELLGDAE